jgi:hypothetical protein
VYLRDRPAQRSPPSLVHGECYDLLVIGYQMGTKDWPHSRRITRTLKFDCSVHAVGIGACESRHSPLSRSLSHHLRTRDAESEGEVSVSVKVREHLKVSSKR